VPRNSLKIRAVEANSPAFRAGLVPGDEIQSLNGYSIPDELALRFHLADDECADFTILREGAPTHIQIDMSQGESLGIEVEDFHTRTCNNQCLFCFIHQLPPDVRPTLKVKDDDFRLSFLHGNYITLTNLADRDLDRIIEQALSPLYVSVHATDPELRAKIMGRKKPDALKRKLKRLIDGGIRIHTQIVLLPGINDGGHLERTVMELFGFYPGVQSIAIVPLGLSDYSRSRLKPATPAFCRRVVHQTVPWQQAFRRQIGSGFAYLADEFYIQAGLDIPQTSDYDDFSQIEDGVGMVRKFMNEFEIHLHRRRRERPGLHATLATGKLFFPFLSECTKKLNRKLKSSIQVVEVANRFLGSRVTVAGLLSGGDFIHALAGRSLGEFVVIPNESVSCTEGIFLDDMTPKEVAKEVGVPILPGGPTMRDFFSRL
jgi:putative radical SAM enzyme (TIGR03279 family)